MNGGKDVNLNVAGGDGGDGMPALDDRADRQAGPRVPYPGLRPFDRDEWLVFFGRRDQTAQLIEKLGRARFVAVVGPSGCGKSSLVRAGLIAAVQNGLLSGGGERWRVAEMRPGDSPMARLAEALLARPALRDHWGDGPAALGFMEAALRRGPLGLAETCSGIVLPEGENLLLLVDQFEEIFRYRRESAKVDESANSAPRLRGDGAVPQALDPGIVPRALAAAVAAARSASAALRQAWRETVPRDGASPAAAADTPAAPGSAPTASPASAGPVAADEADAFVALLLKTAEQAGRRIYIVLTMRADFLGDCAIFAGLPEAINDGQFLVPRLTREQRRAAIAGPAEAFDGAIDPPLVGRLLNDMSPDPDQLPVLQHALMRMWAQADGPTDGLPDPVDDPADADCDAPGSSAPRPPRRRTVVTQAHYDAVGGLDKALSDHANGVMAGLTAAAPQLADVVEAVFRLLVDVTPDNRRVRRPRRLHELCERSGAAPADVARVIDAYRAEGVSFLVPPLPAAVGRDSLIDISHESLIQRWDKLRRWSDDTARWARVVRRLKDAAALWDERDRPDDSLHRGLDLVEAGQAETRDATVLSATDRAFLAASRSRAQRDRWRKAWPALATVGVLLAIAGVSVGVWSWMLMKKANDAARQANDAEHKATVSQANAESAAAVTETLQLSSLAEASIAYAPQRGLLLAAEAFSKSPSSSPGVDPAVDASLRNALARVNGLPLLPGRSILTSAVNGPAGGRRWLVTFSGDDKLRRWDLAATDGPDGAPIPDKVISIQAAKVKAAVLDQTGRFIVIADTEGKAALWDLQAADPEKTAVQVTRPGLRFFAAQFATAPAAAPAGATRPSNLVTNTCVIFTAGQGAQQSAQWSDVSSAPEFEVAAIDLNWGSVAQRWAGKLRNPNVHPPGSLELTVSDDGIWLTASGHAGRAIVEMRGSSPLPPATSGTGNYRVDTAVRAVSADGRTVVTEEFRVGSGDFQTVWRFSTAPDGDARPVSAQLIVSPDDDKKLSLDEAGQNQGWDGRFKAQSVAISATGKRVAMADEGGRVCVWTIEAGSEPKPKLTARGRHARGGVSLYFSPDERWLITVPTPSFSTLLRNPANGMRVPGVIGATDKAYVWALDDPSNAATLAGEVGTSGIRPIFSSDGRWVATWSPPTSTMGDTMADFAAGHEAAGRVDWWRLPARDDAMRGSPAKQQGAPPSELPQRVGADTDARFVEFLPGGSAILVARRDGSMRTWGLYADGRPTSAASPLNWHEQAVSALAGAPAKPGSATRLVSVAHRRGEQDGAPDEWNEEVAVWRLDDRGAPIGNLVLPIAGGGPKALEAISPEGRWIAAIDARASGGIVWQRDLGGKGERVRPSDAMAYSLPQTASRVVSDVRISKGGKMLATLALDPDARSEVGLAPNGGPAKVQLHALSRPGPGGFASLADFDAGSNTVTDWGFGADERWLFVTPGIDPKARKLLEQDGGEAPRPRGVAKMWRVDREKPQAVELPDKAQLLYFSPDARWLAINSTSINQTTIFDLENDPDAKRPMQVPGRLPLSGNAFDGNGRLLTDDNGTARLWDLREPGGPKDPALPISFGTTTITDCQFATGGRRLLLTFLGRSDDDPRIFEPKGLLVSTAATAIQKASKTEDVPVGFGTAFSPDGSLIAIASAGGLSLRRLDAYITMQFKSQRGRTAAILGFSPDARWLVARPDDRAALFRVAADWNGGAPTKVAELPELNDDRGKLAFDSKSRWMALAGQELVRLYDLSLMSSQAELPEPVVLQGFAKGDVRVRFSDDGSTLITRDAEAIRAWPMDGAGLVDRARAVAGRDFTDAERKRYRIDREPRPVFGVPSGVSPPPAVAPPPVPANARSVWPTPATAPAMRTENGLRS